MALKVAPDRDAEASVLGPLDHRSVMPVLSVMRQAETGLRALCMPYRPGLPLDEVVRRVHAAAPRDAGALWRALGSGGRGPGPGWRDFPARGRYADAAAWTALTLAEALVYVHSRGVVHGDIKPANVLLAAREGPQLLDFGLARSPGRPASAGEARYGGTPAYMAPEQLEAFLVPELRGAVGPASDLYGIGRLLEELLTGRPPRRRTRTCPCPGRYGRRQGPPPRVAAGVAPGRLRAIVERCLACRPEGRYPDAGSLAGELRGYLSRRPRGRGAATSMTDGGPPPPGPRRGAEQAAGPGRSRGRSAGWTPAQAAEGVMDRP